MFSASDATSGCSNSMAACPSRAASAVRSRARRTGTFRERSSARPRSSIWFGPVWAEGGLNRGLRQIQLRERRQVVALLLERECELGQGARAAGLVLPCGFAGRTKADANRDLSLGHCRVLRDVVRQVRDGRPPVIRIGQQPETLHVGGLGRQPSLGCLDGRVELGRPSDGIDRQLCHVDGGLDAQSDEGRRHVIARSRDGLSETGDRADGIAKVGQEGAALHLADPDVRRRPAPRGAPDPTPCRG